MLRNLLLLVCSLCLSATVNASDIVGKWRTIDDETGKPKSIVEIYERGGKYYGRVVDLLMKPNDTLCEKCPGPRRGQPVVGMDIVTGMVKNGDIYEGGEILDPTKGKVYDCKMWREGNQLKVRGYLGFFYRTQGWQRVE